MILGGMLVRNEADRWLVQACNQLHIICDQVYIIDDKSTDNTVNILKQYPFILYESAKQWWEIDELKQRKKLFNMLWMAAKEGDVILILDADELVSHPKKVREILTGNNSKVFGFRLYDMWSDTHYRDDQYWYAHYHFWPMAIRKGITENFTWNEQGLHCGRFPNNFHIDIHSMTTKGLKIKHMGWSTPKDREQKYKRYMAIDPDGKYGILEQYLSILDPDPALRRFKDD